MWDILSFGARPGTGVSRMLRGTGYRTVFSRSADFMTLAPKCSTLVLHWESLAAVLRRIGRSGMAMIPVVEGDYLIGLITFQNLMRKLTALSLRRPTAKASAPNVPAPQA